MSLNLEFCSALAPVITRYLDLMTALGRRFSGERATLRSLDGSLVTDEAEDLTLDSFLRWTRSLEHRRRESQTHRRPRRCGPALAVRRIDLVAIGGNR